MRTLATLTRGIELPWQWGQWAVNGATYGGEVGVADFSVTYDGDHLFGIFPFEPDRPLPTAKEVPIDERELEDFCVERLQGMAQDGSDAPAIGAVESVLFFNQPAMLSICLSPPEGPVEHAFVELFFGRGSEGWSWIELWASNHEWDTIDPRAVAAFAPVFREFVAAHSEGPATADNPPPPVGAIGRVAPGARCRDLHADRFSYREAVAYWMSDGLSERMDADRNGIPCETVYPAFVVEIVFGAPQWLDVEITTTSTDSNATFEAAGPAVVTGVMCASGTVDAFDPDAWGWAESDAQAWTRANEYNCDDGSGTFVIGHRDHIVDARDAFATWIIGTTGTGVYEYLSGGGRDHFTTYDDTRSQDRLTGRIAIDEQG